VGWGVVVFVAPKAGTRAVGVHQAGNQDSEEEHSEDRFDDRQGAGVRGDRRDAWRAQRRQRAETVVDEIEAIGNLVKVSVGIEVERAGMNDRDEMVDAGETESDEEVDTESAEDGFRIGMISREDPFENDTHNKDVETETEDDARHSESAGVGEFEQPNVLGHRGSAKKDTEDQERAPIADGVNAEEDDAAADDAQHVVAGSAAVGKRVDDQRRDQKDEEEHVTACRGRSGRGRRRSGDGDGMFERGCVGHFWCGSVGIVRMVQRECFASVEV
jgi:hypothetical protein